MTKVIAGNFQKVSLTITMDIYVKDGYAKDLKQYYEENIKDFKKAFKPVKEQYDTKDVSFEGISTNAKMIVAEPVKAKRVEYIEAELIFKNNKIEQYVEND